MNDIIYMNKDVILEEDDDESYYIVFTQADDTEIIYNIDGMVKYIHTLKEE